jgi:hypothetical protein
MVHATISLYRQSSDVSKQELSSYLAELVQSESDQEDSKSRFCKRHTAHLIGILTGTNQHPFMQCRGNETIMTGVKI